MCACCCCLPDSACARACEAASTLASRSEMVSALDACSCWASSSSFSAPAVPKVCQGLSARDSGTPTVQTGQTSNRAQAERTLRRARRDTTCHEAWSRAQHTAFEEMKSWPRRACTRVSARRTRSSWLHTPPLQPRRGPVSKLQCHLSCPVHTRALTAMHVSWACQRCYRLLLI